MKGFMDFLTLMKTYGTSGLETPPFEYLFDYDSKSLDSLQLLFE